MRHIVLQTLTWHCNECVDPNTEFHANNRNSENNSNVLRIETALCVTKFAEAFCIKCELFNGKTVTRLEII